MSRWLDLCGDDSNLSMKSDDFRALQNEKSQGHSVLDPDIDLSQGAMNQMIKRTKISNENSNSNQMSKKRVFSQACVDDKREVFTFDDDENSSPPKAKLRTNEKGDWKRKKTNNEEEVGFGRFLNGTNDTNLHCEKKLDVVQENVVSPKKPKIEQIEKYQVKRPSSDRKPTRIGRIHTPLRVLWGPPRKLEDEFIKKPETSNTTLTQAVVKNENPFQEVNKSNTNVPNTSLINHNPEKKGVFIENKGSVTVAQVSATQPNPIPSPLPINVDALLQHGPITSAANGNNNAITSIMLAAFAGMSNSLANIAPWAFPSSSTPSSNLTSTENNKPNNNINPLPDSSFISTTFGQPMLILQSDPNNPGRQLLVPVLPLTGMAIPYVNPSMNPVCNTVSGLAASALNSSNINSSNKIDAETGPGFISSQQANNNIANKHNLNQNLPLLEECSMQGALNEKSSLLHSISTNEHKISSGDGDFSSPVKVETESACDDDNTFTFEMDVSTPLDQSNTPQHPAITSTNKDLVHTENTNTWAAKLFPKEKTNSTTPSKRQKCNDSAEKLSERNVRSRQKLIAMGKNTIGYIKYRALVPKAQRDRCNDPITPDAASQISKRRWQGKLQKWRRQLHEFDNIYVEEQLLNETKEMLMPELSLLSASLLVCAQKA